MNNLTERARRRIGLEVESELKLVVGASELGDGVGFFSWLNGRFSQRHRAIWLYRRGMIKAKLRDHESAVADYTAVIEMPDAPADVRAMSLYNRSLVYSADHDNPRAVGDLKKLLAMEGAAANVRTAARQKLVRIQRASDQHKDHLGKREH